MVQRRGKKEPQVEAKQEETKTATCGICKKDISEDPTSHEEQSIECECCMKWFHAVCESIEEAKHKAIKEFNLHWYCTQCNVGAAKLYQHCANLQAEQIQLKDELKQFGDRLTQAENHLEYKVSNDTLTTKLEQMKA